MPDTQRQRPVLQHRSLFLSDLHLGALGGRADLVLRFLQRNRAEKYLLVGDILDLWHPAVPAWGPVQQAVIDHLRARHAEGAELVYVRGNHDPVPDRAPVARRLPVPAEDAHLHHAADGRRYLVVHGDGQDSRLFRAHLLTRLGSWADHGLRALDRLGDRWLRETPPHRRSAIEALLAAFNHLSYRSRAHEGRLVALARAAGADGVVCGHFHIAALHDRHGLVYANCGDWMDSFTAVAEDHSGRFRLMGGREAYAASPALRPLGVRA